jgi:pimeloyl-ACP methyl ester carboxylesterase
MPFAAARDCELYFDVTDATAPWATREMVLFCHGLGSESGAWAGWLSALVDRYRIVRFDLRGHGRSSRPAADAALSFDALCDDLFAVADAAGAQRFHLVGESIGGTIALACAARRPGRVLTLTVSNGAHRGASIQAVHDWRRIIGEGGMAGWSAHMMRHRFFDGVIDEPRRRWYEAQQATVSPDLLLRAVELLVGADLTPELGEVAMPTLLLHGDSSPFIPVEVMADLRAKLPDARLQVFPHAKHGLPFSHAGECAAVLRRFLDEVAPPQPKP